MLHSFICVLCKVKFDVFASFKHGIREHMDLSSSFVSFFLLRFDKADFSLEERERLGRKNIYPFLLINKIT